MPQKVSKADFCYAGELRSIAVFRVHVKEIGNVGIAYLAGLGGGEKPPHRTMGGFETNKILLWVIGLSELEPIERVHSTLQVRRDRSVESRKGPCEVTSHHQIGFVVLQAIV